MQRITRSRGVTAVLLILCVFTVIPTVRAQSSMAPDFTLPVVGPNGLTGKSVTLSSFRGKVVLLDFMEPWCDHCQNQAPILDSLYSNYGSRNVVFISIAGPWSGATANDAALFIRTYSVSWLSLYDSGSVFTRYGIDSVPDYFFIDQRGQIVVNYVGEQMYDTLDAALLSAFPTSTLSFAVSPGSVAAIADLTVDGQAVRSGTQFSWNQGTRHTLSVQKIVAGNTPGTQYVFTGWSDGVTDATRTITTTNDTVYTAQYTTQYQLTINSDHGNPAGGGWYDEDSKAYALLNTGTASDGIIYNWDFAGWTNDASGMNLKSNPITMDGPKTATATWNHDFTIVFYGIIVAVIAVAAVVGIASLKRRKAPETSRISAQTTPLSGEHKLCPECGAMISDKSKFCKECGTTLS